MVARWRLSSSPVLAGRKSGSARLPAELRSALSLTFRLFAVFPGHRLPLPAQHNR